MIDLLAKRHSMMGVSGGASTLLTGLVSYWKLDESSGDAIDSVGSNNGTVVGATQGVTGKAGTAYSFNGDNDYVNIDTVINDLNTTTTGTWGIWVKPVDATPTASETFISFGNETGLHLILISVEPDGTLRAQLNNSAGTRWRVLTNSAIFSDNTWVQIVIVHDGVEAALYVDGQKPAQSFNVVVDKSLWFNGMPGNLNKARIGDLNVNNNGEIQHFNGILDEVGIWNRDLSTDEIAELYNSGNGNTYPF